MERVINRKTTRELVESLSGLFIGPRARNGLTKKEIEMVTILVDAMKAYKEVDKEIKNMLSNSLSQSYQVTVNYLNMLRKKGVLDEDYKPHPIFYAETITIKNGSSIMQQQLSEGSSTGARTRLKDSKANS